MSLSSNIDSLATRIATEFNTVREELLEAGANIFISETTPTDPTISLWFNSTTGMLYVKYDNTWISQGGPTGADGLSAYEVAVENGYTGTEAQWLASLVGETGETGPAGADAVIGGTANQVVYKDSSNVATGSAKMVFDGTNLSVDGKISAMASSGDEGGEIFLNKAATNTTITNGVTIDIHQNKLRIFEQGGSVRGFFLDMTAGGAGVGTSLVPDNTAWTTYTPTWTADTGTPSIGNGSISGRYKQIGKTVFFSLKLVYGSTTSGGSGAWSFGLPITAQNSDYQFAGSALDSGVAWYPAIGNGNYKGSTTSFTATTSAASTHTYQGLGPLAPFTWGSGDSLNISGSYEAA